MPVQKVNWDLVELLKPFFWGKTDTLPAAVMDCQFKLCSPDGSLDPVLATDNDGNITWTGKTGSPTEQRFFFDSDTFYTAFFQFEDWVSGTYNESVFFNFDSDGLWGKLNTWNMDVSFDCYDNEAHTFEVTALATFYSAVLCDDILTVSGSTEIGGNCTIFNFLVFDDRPVTISGGIISTAVGSWFVVETQGGAASDDLDTISNGVKGAIAVLTAANDAHTVVVKNGTGNIKLAGSDCTLDNVNDTLTLMFNGSNWLELSRSDNGA